MKRTKEEARVTKEKLIDTAFKEFLETGFDKCRLEDIAAKANVTRGAFYWHFDDKKDLLESIIEYKDIEAIKICSEIYESKISALDKLNKIISLNFPEFKKAKSEANYVRLKVELYNYYIKHGDKRKLAETFVETCHLLLKQLKQEGKVKEGIDVKSAAFTILALCSGSYIRYNSLPERTRSLSTLKKNVFNYLNLILK